MRVLIVDDSVVFRSQIKAALENVAGVEVVGTANNGKIAIQKLEQESVDLITLDMEMPEMSGIETIKEIRKRKSKVRIIVFSSYTTRGSEMTLEALELGADDFVAKPTGTAGSITSAAEAIKKDLVPKIMQFFVDKTAKTSVKDSAPSHFLTQDTSKTLETYPKKDLDTFIPSVIVIGSSTGGPPALEKVLMDIKKPLRIPILIAQHMPPVFTASLAKRLQELTGIEAAEGKQDEPVIPNRIYIAPGNYHMTVKRVSSGYQICLDQGPLRNSVRPAVDPLFESASELWGPKCMGIILTGMGEDGMLGCRAIKKAGGGVQIQDQASCAVFGMPGAVYAAKLYDGMSDPSVINRLIRRMTG